MPLPTPPVWVLPGAVVDPPLPFALPFPLPAPLPGWGEPPGDDPGVCWDPVEPEPPFVCPAGSGHAGPPRKKAVRRSGCWA